VNENCIDRTEAVSLFESAFGLRLGELVGREDAEWPVLTERDSLAQIEKNALRDYAQIRHIDHIDVPVSGLRMRDVCMRHGAPIHDVYVLDIGEARLVTVVARQ